MKVIVEKYGSRKGIDVHRKLEGLMWNVFGGILETAGCLSPTLSPSRLGTDPA
jgi:hypothetical protein